MSTTTSAATRTAVPRESRHQTRQEAAQQARPGRLDWLRVMLNKPLASFHLVLGSAGMLVALGLMMVLSSSSVYAYQYEGDAYYYLKRQAVFLGVGLIGAYVVTRLSRSLLRVVGWIALFVSAGMLVLTYTPLGVTINGNRNWLQLGTPILQLQPSEFAKLAMIIWAADILARKDKLLDQPKHLLIPFLPVTGLMILLVVFQGDAGTAVVMAGIVAGVLWIVGAPMRIFASIGVIGIVGVIGLFITSPNRMGRLAAFLNPTADTAGANLQSTVAMRGIASGGWWGVGLGASREKWGSLPEAHTDYIFAVIGEELGLFGTLAVLGLFLVLGYAGLRIALRSDDKFHRYLAAGVTSWFMVQTLINLGVVLRLLPVAGVPLPLLSYGGSALMANVIAVGVLIACARNEPAARRVLARAAQQVRPEMTTVVDGRGRAKSSAPSGRRKR
ncbi:putative lipid II flippase FtsW [Microlunatus endophyticus]|uniref:putative lipid II flippase FtsW n=1 Tax=Microlunatus endophyticus TaxID=1716077 RepID=UPI001E48D1C8|nr:putative lipid II flippase FtsW [Microlunatus endophyticus]